MKTAPASGMKNSLALVVKNGLSPMMKNALAGVTEGGKFPAAQAAARFFIVHFSFFIVHLFGFLKGRRRGGEPNNGGTLALKSTKLGDFSFFSLASLALFDSISDSFLATSASSSWAALSFSSFSSG